MLLIMQRERRRPLLDVLEASGIDLLLAHDLTQARSILENRQDMHVLLTDTALRDEDWIEMYEVVARLPPHVQTIVCCHRTDHRQWVAAAELGAYDVLVEPYELDEVRRTLEAAASCSQVRSLSSGPRSPHTLWISGSEKGRVADRENHC